MQVPSNKKDCIVGIQSVWADHMADIVSNLIYIHVFTPILCTYFSCTNTNCGINQCLMIIMVSFVPNEGFASQLDLEVKWRCQLSDHEQQPVWGWANTYYYHLAI